MAEAVNQSPAVTGKLTRLEKEAEFLFHIARCSALEYNKAIEEASEERLKAVLECMRNIHLFKRCVPAVNIEKINEVLAGCLDSPTTAKATLRESRVFVQSILAEIFLKIILAEFHFLFCL